MAEITAGISKGTVARTKSGGFIYNITKYYPFYIMMIPGLLFFALFRYAPIYGLQIAFRDFYPWEGIWQSPWIGFDNFKMFFRSAYFGTLFVNTFTISIYKLVFGFPAPILLALLLNEIYNAKLKRTVQTITYFPHFLSWVLIYSLAFNMLNKEFGLVNLLIKNFGFEPVPFLMSQQYFRGILTVSTIWKEAGWGSIIYLAALSGIDSELYDAANVDGANRWRQLIHITLPSLYPTMAIMLLLRIGNILSQDFEQVLMFMGGTQNEFLATVGETYETFVYKIISQGISSQGYGAAVGMFQSVFCLILVLITNQIATKKLGYRGLF